MTTTVLVKARAHGAIVTVKETSPGEEGHEISSTEVEVAANRDQTFHIHQNQSVTVREGNPPVPTTADEANEAHARNEKPFIGEAVPGAAENDKLLGRDPLDHDGDGRKGGSLKKEDRDSGSTFQG